MIRKILITLLFVFLKIWIAEPLFSQEIISPEDAVEQKINRYIGYVSPRKVYLHINKTHYDAGDAIWFKAYLFNGVGHSPDTASVNLYVDLVSSTGTLMERRILLVENGFAEGDISLPNDIPDGNYKVVAYTDWMRNFGEEFYFNRYFYIHNQSYASIIPRSEARANRRFNRQIDDLKDVTNIVFFPEGGRMVDGVSGRVAFKAFNGLGQGIDAEGEILDGSSVVLASFNTNDAGTGSFELKPEAGKEYIAQVSFSGERPQEFNLPESLPAGTAVRVEQDDTSIMLNIASTHTPGDMNFTGEVVVVAHTRGKLIFGESVPLKDGRALLTLPKDEFPSGVAHLTVFNKDLKALAERLVFIFHDDTFVFFPDAGKQQVGDREYYVINLDVTDKDGDPVEGHFSMSVIHTGDDVPVPDGNIVSNLLISSDIPGITEEAHKYFDPERDMSQAIDLLMMTHGWRRFSWEDVLASELPEIDHMPRSSLAISGVATDPSRDQPLPNFPVKLEITGEDNGIRETTTDNRGVFVFDGLQFHDDVRIRLSTDRLVSNHPPDLVLHSRETRGIDYVPNSFTLPQLITSRGKDWERTPGAGRSPYSDEIDDPAAPQQYGVPDQTVYIERDSKQPNMYDILVTRIRGLNHNLQFRGPTSIQLSSQPLFLLDGTEIGQSAFLNLDPRYVERIEVFSGPRASVFGVRGASGAIIGYTRRAGDPGLTDYEDYLIQGYHSPREYYSDLVSTQTGYDQRQARERSVYWEPNLVSDDSGSMVTSVPVVSTPGILTFIIEGAGAEGGLGFGIFSIRSSR